MDKETRKLYNKTYNDKIRKKRLVDPDYDKLIREKRAEWARKCRRKNPLPSRKASIKWNLENPDKTKELNAKSYQKNKTRILEKKSELYRLKKLTNGVVVKEMKASTKAHNRRIRESVEILEMKTLIESRKYMKSKIVEREIIRRLKCSTST